MPRRLEIRTLDSAQTRQELLLRLARLPEQQPPLWGRMHAAAMLRHLREAFELALNERPVKQHPHLLRGRFGRWLVLYSGMPWVRHYQTLPEVDILLKQEKIEDFEAERRALVEIMITFSECSDERLLPEHPFFGSFRHKDWMRWAYLHTDHHLRQFGI